MFSSSARAGGIVVTACAVLAGSARADTRTFFGFDPGLGESLRLPATPNADAARNQFLDALLDGVRTETFESFLPDREAPLVIAFGDDTATITGSGSVTRIASGTNNAGRYSISGDQFWESGNLFTLDFSSPQSAFGFYATDIGDFDGRVTLTLTGSTTRTITVPTPLNAAGGSAAYFGIVETDAAQAFTRITFGNTSVNADLFGFDDFSIATRAQVAPETVVPEPAGLFLPAIACVAARRRRRL